ncbi:MAG: hypothetical protein KC680_00545 [Candidatus Peregrinibacteria bacterium]|nr:hypothetical protein [Candidatus Peregrinibacteria bacterium]MCB9807852.1 hypothetical protein [Candidatus Peribacteria bacterium]
MKYTTLVLTLMLALIQGVPTAAAYNGTVTDIRYGEHPYEQRTREENLRKRLAARYEKYGYATFDNPAYFDPIYARRSVLHPFYRKGGTSQYVDTRYAGWRGYQDPIQARNLSPDTYCTNFTYSRANYRVQPEGYQCF